MLSYLSSSMMYSFMLVFFSFLSLFMGVFYMLMDMVVFVEWELFYMPSLEVVYTFLFDWMSLLFLGVVTLISSMVLIYSYSYMKGDIGLNRFITLVYLFVLSMVMMILSPNLISILLGWDGLGLVSYALVIYYQNTKSSNAGMITVLSNRVGDVALLIGISWALNYGSWDFLYLQYVHKQSNLIFVLVLVMLAGLTKSAQLPFSAWLPAAMAAPTPVSALVHSSTLVTAGVYLLIRFNELVGVNLVLLTISSLTMFMSGLGASLEFDLKKIIALSTLSQLGVMMMVLSLGLYELAFFHLISHAMFKSLLFLCAGFYIHSSYEHQDIRSIGKIMNSYPLANMYFIGCSLSLCGFPFMAGFYSKDLILDTYFMMSMNWLIYLVLLVGTMLTIVYNVRLMYYIYVKSYSNLFVAYNEEDLFMLVPKGILFSVSVFIGSMFSWVFMPPSAILLPFIVKMTVLVMGLVIAVKMLASMLESVFMFNIKHSFPKRVIMWFTGHMWFLHYTISFEAGMLLASGEIYQKVMDNGWLEILGGQGGMMHIMKTSTLMDKWNMMSYKIYLFLMFFMILAFLVMF